MFVMIIQLATFQDNLKGVPYLQYELYQIENILFVTLYKRDEMEKFIIIESLTNQQYTGIKEMLERFKNNAHERSY